MKIIVWCTVTGLLDGITNEAVSGDEETEAEEYGGGDAVV